MEVTTVEPQSSPGNKGVHKSENVRNSEIINFPPRYCVVLFNFHDEYAAMISIEHKLANTEAR